MMEIYISIEIKLDFEKARARALKYFENYDFVVVVAWLAVTTLVTVMLAIENVLTASSCDGFVMMTAVIDKVGINTSHSNKLINLLLIHTADIISITL
jgi:hypothetical protein